MRIVVVVVLMVFVSLNVAANNERYKKIQTFKKMRIIEILEMDENVSEKFFVKYNTYEKKISDLRKQLLDIGKTMSDDLDEGKNNVGELKEQEIFKIFDELSTVQKEKLRVAKSILSPLQYSKLIVFELRFMEEIQEILSKRLKRER